MYHGVSKLIDIIKRYFENGNLNAEVAIERDDRFFHNTDGGFFVRCCLLG